MASFIVGQLVPTVPARPQIDLNFKIQCKDCKNPVPNIVESFATGDMICGDCGLVLGNRIIDTRSEWRTFSNSDDSGGDPSRVGAAQDPLLGGNALLDSTGISQMDGGTGKSRELSRAHQRVIHSRGDENILTAFTTIQHMGERISLSRIVIDSAKQLFRKVDENKLLKGKSPEAIQAACIYIACREHNVTRTFKEICNLTRVSKKEIGKCYKALQPHFEQKTEINLDSYITRFASNLDIAGDVRKQTLEVANRVMDKGTLAGKSPISLVAACLYLVSSLSKDPKPSKLIAEIAGCTEATLKNAYRLLLPQAAELLKDLTLYKSIDTLS